MYASIAKKGEEEEREDTARKCYSRNYIPRTIGGWREHRYLVFSVGNSTRIML